MDSTVNPYESPLSRLKVDGLDVDSPDDALPLHAFVSPEATRLLGGTRIWAWIIGLVLSLAGLAGCTAVVWIMTQGAMLMVVEWASSLFSAAMYLLMGLLSVRYGWRIGKHLKRRDGDSLLAAMDAQRQVFQMLGMLAICWIMLTTILVVWAIMA